MFIFYPINIYVKSFTLQSRDKCDVKSVLAPTVIRSLVAFVAISTDCVLIVWNVSTVRITTLN